MSVNGAFVVEKELEGRLCRRRMLCGSDDRHHKAVREHAGEARSTLELICKARRRE